MTRKKQDKYISRMCTFYNYLSPSDREHFIHLLYRKLDFCIDSGFYTLAHTTRMLIITLIMED